MDLREYQLNAQETDQVPGTRADSADPGIVVPLLGPAGWAGTLLTEYKKWLRESASYQTLKERVREGLGDFSGTWVVTRLFKSQTFSGPACATRVRVKEDSLRNPQFI